MLRYVRYSLGIHIALLAALGFWTWFAPRQVQRHMKFVILPKGTSMDAVLTRDLEEAIRKQQLAAAETPVHEPTATPVATMLPALQSSPTPMLTPVPTPAPEKTIAVTPKATQKVIPTATAAKATPRKTPKPSPTKASKSTATPAKKASAKATKTPPITSAYDIKKQSTGKLDGTDLPRKTPAGVKAVEKTPVGSELGVPGVADGVEGAPLPLDRNQGMLSMLYTTRARMRIQANFTVPPGVDDPNMTCVVEWEILPDGTIRNARIVKSTGVAQYDARALEALQRTVNLGSLPPEFGQRPIWTSLTFVFAGDGSKLAGDGQT